MASKAAALAQRVEAARTDAAGQDWAAGAADDDASFFRLKQQMLLQYATDLSYLLLRKARGQTVGDHDVVKRLFELRVVLEKLRPLESKLRHQLDRVLQRTETAPSSRPQPRLLEKAPERAAPRRAAAASHDESEGAGGKVGTGIYRAPRHAAAPYDGGEDEDNEGGNANNSEEDELAALSAPSRERKGVAKERQTRARRSEMLRLLDQTEARPETRASDGASWDGPHAGVGQRAAKKDRLRKESRDREKFEEDRFMRVDTNKKIKKKRRIHDAFSSSVEDLI